MPKSWGEDKNLEIITASILELKEKELIKYTSNCDAVASCLWHNITFKGIYGQPRKLVTDATKRLCNTIKNHEPNSPIKYVLMNISGNSNRDLNEPNSFAQKFVIGILRLLLPPHVDNEKATDYLRTEIGQNNGYIEWVVVRPDGLINEKEVTEYGKGQMPVIYSKTSLLNLKKYKTQHLITKRSACRCRNLDGINTVLKTA